METKISRIKKRDGTVVSFDQSKITNAIFKAAQSVGGKDRKIAVMLSDKVVEELEKQTLTPSVEQIQDIVEKVLIENGHTATAKAYILYRQERAAIRKEKQIVLEKEEVDEVDKRFDVNALRVLKARYLRKDATGKLIETPKQLFTRVAVHAALPDLFYDTRIFDINSQQPVNMVEDFKPAVHEEQYSIGKYKLNRYHLEALKRMYDRFNRNKQIKVTFSKFLDMIKKHDFDEYESNIDEFYNLMTHKLFMPNTPAIANFGNPLGMGSACFHPNQPIITKDGPKEIKDIKAGDVVLTHKGRFRRVEKVFIRFAESLLQVNCGNLPKPTMLVTEEHPVLSFKNNILQWTPISKLRKGDSVALSYPKTVFDGTKVNENHNGDNTVLLNDTLRDIYVETMKFTEIDEISKVDYVGPVYNLEVEEDHSYVANMVSVHNCFVLDVPDSIDGIMETLKNTAIVFKAGGGMGYNFSKLRPEGDFVSSTGGVASGPLSFMRLFDTMTEVIKQGGCVATDTMVRTDKGIVPMINMLNSPPLRDNPTDYFVYDGDEYNYTWLAQNNGIASVYTIETELGNELKATGNHLMAVATSNGIEWKRVDSIREGDWLVTILGGYQGKKIELPRIEKQHHNSNPLKIPEFLNEELAELLGLYVSDGCFNRGRLIFSVDARDKDLITRIEYLVQTVFGIRIGEKRDKVTYFDLVFFSKTLEKFFNELRWMKHRSWNAFVPNEIFRSEESVVSAFLRGLFEGDGSIHPDGYPILYSSSKALIDQVQQLLLSLGIVAKVHKVTKSEKRYGKRQMYKIIILTDKSVNIFKKNIGFISQKKKKLFEQYSRDKKIEYSDLIPTFPTIFSKYYKRVGRGSAKGRAKKGANIAYYRDVYHYLKNDRTLTRTKLQKLMKKHQFLNNDKILSEFSSDDKFFTRVTKISYGLETYTMEIEVPSTSSYIANGLLVHNIRRGANMGILNSNHPDIEKFITAKAGNKALRNFNISVLIMSDFWKHYEENTPYPLVNPKDGKVVKYVNPRVLFDKIVYQAWESAEPGVIFFDKVNDYNPFYEHLGPIVTTNPCVAGDTLISTENGLIPIKELAEEYPNGGIGISVYQNVQSGNLILKKLAYVSEFRAFKTGKKQTIKLTTKTGRELKCTIDHKILTTNGWKEAITLTKQDEIIVDSKEGIDILGTIKPNGIEEIYDITEPSTHSFIANGIVVHNCGEVLLYPNEPCNLGSINVWQFARKNEETGETTVDWEALKEVTMSCTRFLDNVIDVNNFPLKAIEEMSLATRKIGLGVMGVANLLYELRLPYNTEEGRQFMEKLMEFIAYWSKVKSVRLAQTRGNLPFYDKSFYKHGRLPIPGPETGSLNGLNWDKIKQDIKKYGIRNGYTTIIAPTGSISMIAGCSSGMEPVYSVVYEKNVKVGSFYYIDAAAEKVLREEGLFNEKVLEEINRNKGSVQNVEQIPADVRKALVTAMDITPEEHIRALAAFQRWIDSSISKTNNFPADATVEHMRESYILAYRLGCKDVTVFRDTSIKDQVLVAPKAKEQKEEVIAEVKQAVKETIKESGNLMFASQGGHKPMTKFTIKNCPECGSEVELKEGCLHCPGCGWGLCM